MVLTASRTSASEPATVEQKTDPDSPDGYVPVSEIAAVAGQAKRETRRVHPDHAALSAGALVLEVSYAIAIVSPVRDGFSRNSAQRAIPIAGPWLANISWGWALDGLAQLGGVAFVVDGFVNPFGRSARQRRATLHPNSTDTS